MQLTLFPTLEHEDLGAGEGKVCCKCDTYLPLSAFSPSSGANFLRPECKACNYELQKVRERLREEHGMPEEGYSCPICGGDAEKVKGKGNTRNGPWVLDHCHDTETFRGWLCHKCNRALGGFDDDPDILKRALEYLENHLRKIFTV
jgi:hypothetical protein